MEGEPGDFFFFFFFSRHNSAILFFPFKIKPGREKEERCGGVVVCKGRDSLKASTPIAFSNSYDYMRVLINLKSDRPNYGNITHKSSPHS